MNAFELLNGKIEKDEEENSFLHKPAKENKVDVLQTLLDAGFNTNHKNIVTYITNMVVWKNTTN